jgi:hypothetical protein
VWDADYGSYKAKTPPLRGGDTADNPYTTIVDGKAGYSTPTETINKTAFITSYEARK